MVNTMDLGRGFLKLQEDNNSRRSSSLFRHKPLELNESGLHYVTRINCGCGQCVPFRVKVERDDGGLRIGKLTLATNCHLIIVIFGFFFLIAGSVLTALAYKEPVPDPDLPAHARASMEQVDSPSRQEGKVAGPIFIIVGSCLILVGFTLTALACKLNREAKRQLHLSRFTWETPPIQTPDIFNNSTTSHYHSVSSPGQDHYATFSTNNLDTFSVRSRELSTGSVGSASARRDSSFTFHRQQQHPPPPLSTIAQAVPVGIFLFGGGDHVTASPRSPTIQVTDPSGFQEIELSSPTTESAPNSASAFSPRRIASAGDSNAQQQQQYFYNYGRKHRSQSDGSSLDNVSTSRATNSGGDRRRSRDGGGGTNTNLNPNDDRPSGGGGQQNKVNLALRPSLPIIPMFATSPHYFSRVVTPLDARSLYVSSRSDEPFGSIASLSTSGDIACFPVTSSSNTTTNKGGGGGTGVAVPIHGGTNLNMQPTPECDEELSTTATSTSSSSSVITAPSMMLRSSGGAGASANNNANDISNKRNANIYCSTDLERNRTNNSINAPGDDDDYDGANNSTTASSISSSNSHGKSISELPPINVNDFGSKINSSGGVSPGHITGAPVGFLPKSILRQSKSEDLQEGEGGDTADKDSKQ